MSAGKRTASCIGTGWGKTVVYFERNTEMKQAIETLHSALTEPSSLHGGESGHRLHFCPRPDALQIYAIV